MVEELVGCKWSLAIFRAILGGTRRPGAIVKQIDGLSTKVANQCLRKHVSYGILDKRSYDELPPRVEYGVTRFGERFIDILDQIEALESELQHDER